MTELPLLSIIIWLPILGGCLILALDGISPNLTRQGNLSKWIALITAVATFLVSIVIYQAFDNATHVMQFTEKALWISFFDIYYHVGIDGISLPLILLTKLVLIVVVLAAWRSVKKLVPQYLAAFLILSGLMTGVFAALDAILFYVFWEAMLIPMFLAIGMWGGPNRVYATIKFFLYTFLGSVFMLVALLYLATQVGSFSILEMHTHSLSLNEQLFIFIAFLLAFAVKIPMWPVHTWLPDAHVEAPTGGSVILAAIMLKMGGYGFLRFCLPIAPDATMVLDGMMIVLSLIAITYIGLVAIAQQDMKKLIAYSSIAHMGFATLGFFMVFAILNNEGSLAQAALGLEGGIVQMVSHGFISAALFCGVGVLYDRVHSREIKDYGGVVNTMPLFAAFFMLFALANSGLPGTSGFVGEFMVILAAFRADIWIAVFAATTLILGAAYTLWMYKRVIFGDVKNDNVAKLEDLAPQEIAVMTILAIAVLFIGLYPAPLLDMMHASVDNLLQHVTQSKL